MNLAENRTPEVLILEPPVGEKELRAAADALVKYKAGKSALESRVIEDERWYKLRHWEVMRGKKPADTRPAPTSAWLFNTLQNKHADASDNYPQPNVLPREPADRESAKTLSQILPVILEKNGFEGTYSDNWWEKLKHGTAVYGVFWNPSLENGVGDIDLHKIDLLNIFWEPGVTDIEKSRYLFVVDLADRADTEASYPQFAGKLGGNVIDLAQYVYDDDVDTSDKVLIVDCYYKVRTMDGRTLLHMMKFCGECLLFASENEERYRERGLYDHGQYPVIFDTLFPEKGTPVGFGYIAITKDPQLYIDKLGGCMLENALLATRPRYFVSDASGINKEQFLDTAQPIVEVAGTLDDARVRQIPVTPLSGVYFSIYRQKIEELKETAANRDVNSGGASGGVTAAAAIAALQEAGNKSSRDMISGSYRAYTGMMYLCIELIRQFYDEVRTFRITGGGEQGYGFADFSNASLQNAPQSDRRPVFDIKVKAEKRNPFSQMAMNETAKELYRLGAFAPEKAQEALLMLEMMEFEGIDAVREKVSQGQTLLAACQKLAGQLKEVTTQSAAAAPTGGRTMAGDAQGAQLAAMAPYVQRLAQNTLRGQP